MLDGDIATKPKLLVFPPLSELTPEMAEGEFARVRYMLADREPNDGLLALAKITQRMVRLQSEGFLPGEDIPAQLWVAAEIEGLTDHHGYDRVMNVLDAAIKAARMKPAESQPKPEGIRATPYAWSDPETIPPRDWIYGRLLIRKFVTATIAPGGVGKSSLIIAEGMAMVSGRDLLGEGDLLPGERLRVWLYNLEDPGVELTRRIQATAKHYRLEPADIGDRLFVDSGRDRPVVIATATKIGTVIMRPVVDRIVAEIVERQIDVLIIDPFVSCHEVLENDNSAIDAVAKEWGRVSDRGNCAVHLVHHTRKMGGGDAEVTAEDSRGGKALTDACRTARVVNRMTKSEAEKCGVDNARLHFRTYNDKANLAPPADKSDWFKLESVDLGNGPILGTGGDSMGVVVRWKWPDPLEGMTGGDFDKAAAAIRAGRWRASAQSPEWAGVAVAKALDLKLDTRADKVRVEGMIKIWLAAGSLIIVKGEDAKRNPRDFIEVAPDAEPD